MAHEQRDKSNVNEEDTEEKKQIVSNALFSSGSPGATKNNSLVIVTIFFLK